MEDVLDEWISALLKSQIDGEDRNSFSLSREMVCRSSIPCFVYSEVGNRSEIGNTKTIKDRFSGIAKEKDRYLLESTEIGYSRSVETASFIEMSPMCDCDVVRNELIRGFLCGRCYQGENYMNMISLRGMGGVGKNNYSSTCLQRW